MVSLGWVREPEPASWLEGYTLPGNPTLGQKLRGFQPVYLWDRPRPATDFGTVARQTAIANMILNQDLDPKVRNELEIYVQECWV